MRGLFAGLATLDVVSHVGRAPGADEKVTARWQLLAGGGPALNAAVVFAALGGDAVLLTRVGSGPAADLVRADLAACGVHLLDAAAPDATPPVSSVTVEADGTRRVVGLDATGGAPAEVPALPDDVDVVLFDAHHPDLGAAALDLAEERGLRSVLDAGRWKPQMIDLIPRCTDVVASAAFRIDGREDDVEARLDDVYRLMTGPRLAAVTAGGGAVRWSTGERTGEVAPPEVAVVDTLGAGDALHGAYAWALAAGLAEPLAFGVRVASLSCEHRGTRAWLPGAADLAARARG